MLGGIGPTELIVILVIILVVFGAGKLPDIASGLGRGLKDFKKAMQEPDAPDPEEPPGRQRKETPDTDEKQSNA